MRLRDMILSPFVAARFSEGMRRRRASNPPMRPYGRGQTTTSDALLQEMQQHRPVVALTTPRSSQQISYPANAVVDSGDVRDADTVKMVCNLAQSTLVVAVLR